MDQDIIKQVALAAIQMISTTEFAANITIHLAEEFKKKVYSAAQKIMNPRVITKDQLMQVDTPQNQFPPVPQTNNLINFDVIRANLMNRPEPNATVIRLQQSLRERLTQSEDENNLYNFVFFNAATTNISEQLLNYICHENNPGIVPNDNNNNDNPEEQRIREQKIEILALNTLMQTLYDEFITSNSNSGINVGEIDNLSCEGLKYIFIEMIHPRKVGNFRDINEKLEEHRERELSKDEFNTINNFDPEKSVLNYLEARTVSEADISRKLSILNAFLSTTSGVATQKGINRAKKQQERIDKKKALREKFISVENDVKDLRRRQANAAESVRRQTEKRQDEVDKRRRLAGGKTMKKQVRKSSRKQVRKSSRKQMKKQVRKSKQSLKKKARK
jgi:hypothetical protein